MPATDSAQAKQPRDNERADAHEDVMPRAPRININPATGLATDYLNHFNEAIMLLEMAGDCPECMDDFLAWRPMSYREHFAASRLTDRQAAIAAYDGADADVRRCLETLAGTMTAVLEATRAAMRSDLPPPHARMLFGRAAEWLKPLVARAGAVINGDAVSDDGHAELPQVTVDLLMRS